MRKMILLGGIAALSLGGCTTGQQGMPLVFGRTQTVGVSVAGSVPDQGAHLTLGFSDRNIAIVPTSAPNGDPIRSVAPDPTVPGAQFQDSLSVLGQFEVNANATNVSTSLGTFFSTGLAARNLAEGFRDKLRGFGTPASTGSVIPKPGP